MIRAVGFVLGALCLACMIVAAPGCDDTRAEIEATIDELEAAIAAGDGDRFVAGVAPETFQHYDRLIKIALDGLPRQVQVLSLTEKLDILMMRNRSTRKELSKMDGRAWMAHVIRRGWAGGIVIAPEYVDHKNVLVRGSSATLEIVYDLAQPLFSGEGSGRILKDHIDFIKIEDRWFADWRRPATLLERLVEAESRIERISAERVLMALESNWSGKDVDRSILEAPMK